MGPLSGKLAQLGALETRAENLVLRISRLLNARNRQLLDACADPNWLIAPAEIEALGECISRTNGALERAKLVAHKVGFARCLASWPAERPPVSARDAEVLLASIAQKLATKTPHCSGTTGHSWRTIRALEDLNLEQNLLKPIWPVERNAYLLPEKFAAAWANTVLSRQSPYIVEMMPPALETAGLSTAELGAAVDRLAATLRTYRGLPTYADEVVQGAFKLGNDTLRIKYIGGGEISSVYKLSCNGRSSVLKVYAGSPTVSSHGAFGEAAITREAVRQNVTNIPRLEMTNPSESGSWALYEYIPPGAKAPPGMTLKDFLEAHGLKHCDLKETSMVGDYVVDVGGIGMERPCRSSPFDAP